MSKQDKDTGKLPPEWSYKVDVEDIETTPQTIHIEADKGERRDLANRLGIIDVQALKADITMMREMQSHIYYIRGTLHATITQECVVTLKPVVNEVQDKFEAWYSEEDAIVSLARERRERREKPGNIELEIMDEKDDPEPVVDGQIDLGELVAQYLSLALDPYPRDENAESGLPSAAETKAKSPTGGRQNPFAALKKLKKGKETES